jgi:hypothetical protein
MRSPRLPRIGPTLAAKTRSGVVRPRSSALSCPRGRWPGSAPRGYRRPGARPAGPGSAGRGPLRRWRVLAPRRPPPRCGPGVAGVDDRRLAGHRLVLADRDRFGPGAVADGGIGVQQPPVDLIADGVAGDRGADLFDDAGVVTTQDDGELMLGHAPEDTGGDEVDPSILVTLLNPLKADGYVSRRPSSPAAAVTSAAGSTAYPTGPDRAGRRPSVRSAGRNLAFGHHGHVVQQRLEQPYTGGARSLGEGCRDDGAILGAAFHLRGCVVT